MARTYSTKQAAENASAYWNARALAAEDLLHDAERRAGLELSGRIEDALLLVYDRRVPDSSTSRRHALAFLSRIRADGEGWRIGQARRFLGLGRRVVRRAA